MKKKPLITIILGTRPEAIKLAPVIRHFKKCNLIETRLVVTGQHKEMVEQVLSLFELKVQNNLEIMLEKQSLNYITSSSITGLQKEFNTQCVLTGEPIIIHFSAFKPCVKA